MSTTNFRIGRGTRVFLGSITGNTVAYTELLNITEISLPTPEQDEVEVTNFSSPGFSRQFIPGLVDNGEASLTVLYDPASTTETALSSAYTSRATVVLKFQINGVSNANAEAWLCHVKSYGHGDRVSDAEAIKKTATFRISAPYTGT